MEDDHGEAEQGEPLPSASPRGRLRGSLPYWRRTMHQIGLVCALTLSVLSDGFRLSWNPERGPPPACWLRNHPSASAHAGFVTEKVAEGVALGTMQKCLRENLRCILPLGVASNAVGKLRLIWDGRHVNAYLPRRKFRMETLQREGRSLFEQSSWGGTIDISMAYHHIEMHPDSLPFLGFEWAGEFYHFTVLPFGLSLAPWLFTKVMGHCVRFLRSPGCGVGLLAYLDDLIFAAATASGSLRSAGIMLAVLRRFGWLIHPTKCVGTSEAVQAFVALGTLVDLASQVYSVPTVTMRRILAAMQALATGPPMVPVRSVARAKGLITATWVATGVATRIRTRALDAVIDSRPIPRGNGRREVGRCWAALVAVSSAARAEAQWWLTWLSRINGQPIRPRPYDSTADSAIASDASNTGVGAFISTVGATPQSSSLIRALLERAPPGLSLRAVVRHAQQGLEFSAPLPGHLLDSSSTLREMFGIFLFVTLAVALLRGGRHRVILDNLGCVFILGGVVPPFAVGDKAWGEYVSGGSPDPELQAMALKLFDLQLEEGFSLQAVWQPRECNLRADFLSRASELPSHDYSLLPEIFQWLDELWGPHSVDRFATARNRHVQKFCSQYFHPEAMWVDAFTLPWDEELNWVFPPIPDIVHAIHHMRRCRASGTLVVVMAQWSPARRLLRPDGRHWAEDVVEVVALGQPRDCLLIPRGQRHLVAFCEVYALRLDGRRH